MNRQPNSTCFFICGLENLSGLRLRFHNNSQEQYDQED